MKYLYKPYFHQRKLLTTYIESGITFDLLTCNRFDFVFWIIWKNFGTKIEAEKKKVAEYSDFHTG